MSSDRRALITGLTGQDGSFLAELLLKKGYSVTGVVRGGEERLLGSSERLRGQVEIVPGELTSPETLWAAIELVRPTEIYHLAGPSKVSASWGRPRETFEEIVGSCATVLRAVKQLAPEARVFMAASGMMFGNAPESPQREDTPCRPTTPYAIARLAAHQLVGVTRDRDGLHVSSGIVFNHESERRPDEFVTRKVTRAAAEISLKMADELWLGRRDVIRDWSFAGDIMEGAWLMLQQDKPDDYVLASGIGHTVEQLVKTAFACAKLGDPEPYIREGSDLVERGMTEPTTPNVGDPTKARDKLGWSVSVDFEQLIQRMVDADLRSLQEAPASS